MKIALPGMGANSSMYQGPWRDLEDISFLDWPKDLTSYALNDLAEWVSDQCVEVDWIVGSSLGGMIALLAASKLKNTNVVLIGSAYSYKEVASLLKMMQPFADLLPLDLMRYLSGSVPVLLSEMYSHQNSALIRESISDLPNYDWCDPSVEVLRIHGIRDHVIKCPDVVDLKLVGGHLLAMTHAVDVAHLLKNYNELD